MWFALLRKGELCLCRCRFLPSVFVNRGTFAWDNELRVLVRFTVLLPTFVGDFNSVFDFGFDLVNFDADASGEDVKNFNFFGLNKRSRSLSLSLSCARAVGDRRRLL